MRTVVVALGLLAALPAAQARERLSPAARHAAFETRFQDVWHAAVDQSARSTSSDFGSNGTGSLARTFGF